MLDVAPAPWNKGSMSATDAKDRAVFSVVSTRGDAYDEIEVMEDIVAKVNALASGHSEKQIKFDNESNFGDVFKRPV